MSPMMERVRRFGVGAFGLGVSVVSVLLVVHSVDLGSAVGVVARAAPAPLVLALGLLVAGLALRVAIWTILLPPSLNGSRVPARRVVPVLFIGYLGNLVLPARLGEVVRCYLVNRREAVPFGGAFGSVVLERVLDTTALAVLAFAGSLWLGAADWLVRGTGVLAAGGVAVVIVLATTGLGPALRLLERLAAVGPLRRPVTAVVRRLDHFVHWSGGAHRRRDTAVALSLSIAVWLCQALVFWLIGLSVGASVSPAGATLVMATTVLATAIPSAPAYVGTFELAAVTVATSLGVPSDTALALAVVAHVLGTLPAAIGGALSLGAVGGNLAKLSAAAAAAERGELGEDQDDGAAGAAAGAASGAATTAGPVR